MLTLISSPKDLSTTGNPIVWQFETDSQAVRYIAIKILVESELYKNDFTSLIEMAAPPDANKQVKFDLRENLKAATSYSLLNYQLQTAQKPLKTVIRYKMETAEIVNGLPVYAPLAGIKYAIKAAFTQLDFAENKAVLPKGSVFLSSKPLQRSLSNQFAEPIYFIAYNAGSYDLSIKYFYNDQSTSGYLVWQSVSAQRFEIIGFMLSWQKVKALNPQQTKIIERIELSISGYSLKMVLYPVDHQRIGIARAFYYANTLGGYDLLVTTGVQTEGFEIEQSNFEHFLPTNYLKTDAQYETYNVIAQKTFKIASGYKSREENKAYFDFFVSPVKYVLMENKLVRILTSSKKETVAEDKNNLFSLEIEYRLAFDE